MVSAPRKRTTYRPSPTGTAIPGPLVEQVSMVTKTKVYAVDESRLTSLSVLNWVSGLFLTLGCSFWSFAFGLQLDLLAQPPTVAETGQLMNLVTWAIGVVGGVFILIGIVIFIARGSEIKKFKENSTIRST